MTSRVCTIAWVGLLAAPVAGQSGRVEDGRAGDASLRVGSYGRNLPRRTPLRGYANEIMSGNVRRGRHFRHVGDDPTISATTDFGVQLPSTLLDNFRRDSIGQEDIQRGQPSYLPRPYYSRTGTVPTVGGISSGYRPGQVRSLPRTYVHLPGEPLGRRTRYSRPHSREIRISPTSDRPGGPLPSPRASDFERSNDAPLTRSALFGVAPDPARAVLESYTSRSSRIGEAGTSPYSRLRAMPGEATQRETDRQPVTAEERRSALPAGSALDRLLNRGTAAMPLPTPPSAGEDRATPGPETDRRRPASEMRSYTEITAAGQPEPTQPGEEPSTAREDARGDVYRMMRMAASTLKPITPPSEDATADTRAPRVTEAAPGQADETEAVQPPQAPRRPRAVEQHEQLQELLARPVATFAGEAKTLANEAFKEAEKRLKAGRFFDAVTSYDIARAADPENPLVWIGRGHALAGAGDYLSASASLEKGLMRFPEITRFQIDLKAFLGHGDILDIRRADLERRLEDKENYRFRFLLGYLEYYSGLEKFGLANLKQAAKEAPTTSMIAKFPKLLRK